MSGAEVAQITAKLRSNVLRKLQYTEDATKQHFHSTYYQFKKKKKKRTGPNGLTVENRKWSSHMLKIINTKNGEIGWVSGFPFS